VSNFGLDDLAELLAMARIKPALVQRHSDPLAADAQVRAFCRLADVQYQASSLLACEIAAQSRCNCWRIPEWHEYTHLGWL
jgi:diketogulonate reductase-like aldo/keto reductase